MKNRKENIGTNTYHGMSSEQLRNVLFPAVRLTMLIISQRLVSMPSNTPFAC
ncbi:MAG: hypothetical protein ACXV8O_07880 [Methylobacter sp.]